MKTLIRAALWAALLMATAHFVAVESSAILTSSEVSIGQPVKKEVVRVRAFRPLVNGVQGNQDLIHVPVVQSERPATQRRNDRIESSRMILRNLLNRGELGQRLTDSQIAALIMVETSGQNGSIGDNGTSFGVLQIQEGYVADVNERFGTNLRATDCLWDADLSVLVTQAWMNRYTTDSCSFEKKARRHNGGPTGDKKSATLPYWTKVQKAYAVTAKHVATR